MLLLLLLLLQADETAEDVARDYDADEIVQ